MVDVKSFLKNKYEGYKNEFITTRKIRSQIRSKAKSAYFEEKEKQDIEYAKEKARHEKEERVKRLKEGHTGTLSTIFLGNRPGGYLSPSQMSTKNKIRKFQKIL